MDYKTFISSMTAGESIFTVLETTTYEDFLSNMTIGKAMYFSNGTFYSVILSTTINNTQIIYTYYDNSGQYIEKIINR